jgi:hypothetical protein
MKQSGDLFGIHSFLLPNCIAYNNKDESGVQPGEMLVVSHRPGLSLPTRSPRRAANVPPKIPALGQPGGVIAEYFRLLKSIRCYFSAPCKIRSVQGNLFDHVFGLSIQIAKRCICSQGKRKRSLLSAILIIFGGLLGKLSVTRLIFQPGLATSDMTLATTDNNFAPMHMILSNAHNDEKKKFGPDHECIPSRGLSSLSVPKAASGVQPSGVNVLQSCVSRTNPKAD